MLVYRLTTATYARDLSGMGAKLYGGRWNDKSVAMLYTAASRALAVLEVLVHLTPQQVPKSYQMITLEIPNNAVTVLDAALLPPNWQHFDSPMVLKTIGNKWVAAAESLALQVPSALVPEECNILLNPLHPLFEQVKIHDVRPFQFDERLL